MTGLAMIYKKHLNDADVPQATKKAVTWIKDKILHGYYMTGMEDRYSSFLWKMYLHCIVCSIKHWILVQLANQISV
jgi:hypothetical protein